MHSNENVEVTVKNIILRVPAQLHRDFKTQAAFERKTMQSILENFIDGYIKQGKELPKYERVL